MAYLSQRACRTDPQQQRTDTQDLPPAGGFNAIRYKRHLPFRGIGGAWILAGVAAVTLAGIWRKGQENLERRELAREKLWSRIHLVPLLLAEGDRLAYRHKVVALEKEKELMKDVKDWEPGKSVYANPRFDLPNIVDL